MMARLRDATAPGRRRWTTALLATALMASMAGSAWAQEASGSTEISVEVRPAGGEPAPAPTPTPAPGVPEAPLAPDSPNMPILLVPPASPVLGARQAPMPGTVSANVSLVQPHGTTERRDDAVATLIVRDDRGTVVGWDVGLTSVAPADLSWMPTLQENRQDMIRRLLPASGQPQDHPGGVTGGRTLGPFDAPIPVLHAEAGSGSGVYSQQMVLVAPVIEGNGATGLVLVQVPIAP